MSQIKIEDAAFPSNEYGNLGMSLRDYFAGQALAGMLAGSYMNSSKADLPRESYRFADLLLAERKRERE